MTIRRPRWPLVPWMLVGGLLVGCSTTPGTGGGRSGPAFSDRIPWETQGRAGNFTPYRVLGKTYHVMDDATGFSQVGIASWYGSKFHGRHTSNGEIFDKRRVSAAHKSLPIPSWVRINNLDNGRELLVRVNDRGPFHDNRIIDLSEEGARRLGFWRQGTANVRVTALTPRRPAGRVVAAAPAPAAVAAGPLFIHAGVYLDAKSAAVHQQEVSAILAARAPVKVLRKSDVYVVGVGPFDSVADAERYQYLLIAADENAPLIVREPVAKAADK